MENRLRIRRFTAPQRIFHVGLMICFLIQGATGLSRMYMETGWGKTMGSLFGGYEGARTVHVSVGIIMLCWFGLHVLYVLLNIEWKGFPKSLMGPDSILPQPRDLREFVSHVAWLFGIRKPPEIDRYGYWEKFDYWAVFWGMAIIGVTGLMMAFPFAATRIVPGWMLNVAFWIHRIEALLAMAHVFIIHFFLGHLRPSTFPMDQAMFEGSVDLEKTRHERPAWISRLEKNGALESMLTAEAGPNLKLIYYVFGYAAMLAGIILLIGGIFNAFQITW
ncbi:MAG: cytochrome b/b6 domain-containing protein [Thermodesulfobacteriota bacterium]